MGTPALALPSLELLNAEHEIVAVVTQPDKLAGRGHRLTASPVKEWAVGKNIPVLQPERARDESFAKQLREFRPEAMAVVAYGQILPQEVLDMPRENFDNGGCVNLHFSLLPRWRGAAPVQYSIWKGDTVTGVSTQWMAQKLDAGDIILQREVAIAPETNSLELFETLTPLGAEVLQETMRLMQNGKAPRAPQSQADITFAPTLKKEEAQLNWQQRAEEVANQIRAFNPRPTAHCLWNGEPLKIHRARIGARAEESTPSPSSEPGNVLETKERLLIATGNGAIELLEVQPPSKPKMNALDWARGARISVGDNLR